MFVYNHFVFLMDRPSYIIKYISLSLVTTSVLKVILSDVGVAAPNTFELMLTEYLNLLSFAFSLFGL